jgi:hypothetical protein
LSTQRWPPPSPPPDPDPARPAPPARVGFHDPHDLKVARQRLADADLALADARRLHNLVPALAAAADDARVGPDDAVFLLRQAAETVEVSRPFVVPDFDAVATLPPETFDGIDGTDPAFLAGLGVPAEFAAEPARWDGWTAGLVRAGYVKLAATAEWTTGRLFRQLTGGDIDWLEKRVSAARAEVAQLMAVTRGPTAIPPGAALEAILRYEPHVSRQLSRTLEQLEKVRALRR